MKVLFFVLVVVCFVVAKDQGVRTSFPKGDPNNDIARLVSSIIDWSVDPCQDFWSFSCGSWIKNTQLPPDKSSLTRSFTVIQENNQNALQSIVEDPNKDVKINAFYTSCMNTSGMDQQGYAPLKGIFAMIDGVTDINSLFVVVGKLHKMGISTFFELGPVVDSFHPQNQIAGFDQGGLSLPWPSLYTDSDPQSANVRQAYMTYLTNVFTFIQDPNPAQSANATFSLEAAIAAFTADPDALVDPFATYNPMSLAAFKALTPKLPWDSYFPIVNVSITGNLTVSVPSFYSNLSKALPTFSNWWKPYLKAHVLKVRANYLSSNFRNEWFTFFKKVVGGQNQPSPRWRQCIDSTDAELGELLGKYYVEIAFPGTSQKDAVKLLKGILSAMKADLNGLPWMDNTTRGRALTKLSMIDHLIGSPINPETYSSVEIGVDYFTNIQNAEQFAASDRFATIGTLTDRKAWQMTAPTVNAYYDPTLNEMVFPAGILQQPFFNHSFPPEMNAGGIGMVMGHELTHGFDNQGRLYDGTGTLNNWWMPDTGKKFDAKVQCVIDQYSKFSPIPGVHVNGKLTQGENIADMGGIKNSFSALSTLLGKAVNDPSIVPKLSRGQLFFVAFAQGWCTKASDAYYRLHAATDPHSPPMFRVLGPLMNLPAFSTTFNCPAGSPMNPPDRCEVW